MSSRCRSDLGARRLTDLHARFAALAAGHQRRGRWQAMRKIGGERKVKKKAPHESGAKVGELGSYDE